jgi:SseB protein C-terminal domain
MAEEVRISGVRFLKEHDGPPERELKGRLIELLQREETIRAAYLAQVVYAGNQTPVVALCLRADRPDRDVVGKVGEIFSSMFVARQHLDILFLDDGQEAQLAGCCRAFWSTPRL